MGGVETVGADGKPVIMPRSDAELAGLAELVASAVGLDEARGDQLTIKSLPFAGLGEGGTTGTRPGILERLALNELAKLILVGVFAIILIRLLLGPALAARRSILSPAESTQALTAVAQPKAPPAMTPPAIAPPATDLMEAPGDEAGISVLPPEAAKSFPETSAIAEDPVQRLRNLMRERQDESIRVLSSWITDKEAKT